MLAQLLGQPAEADEVHRDQAVALVEQLEVGVLAVGAHRAPHHGPGGGADGAAPQVDRLAVGLHVQLLEVLGEVDQALGVGDDGDALGVEEVGVPDAQQTEQHGQVGLEGGRAEVLVHGPEAGQHLPEAVGPDGHHDRQADGRGVRVATADPVPELEHVGGVDAEGGHLGRCCWRRPRSGAPTASSLPSRSTSQSRALRALVRVSSVVKVLEQTTNRTRSGSVSASTSWRSVPSTLDT